MIYGQHKHIIIHLIFVILLEKNFSCTKTGACIVMVINTLVFRNLLFNTTALK